MVGSEDGGGCEVFAGSGAARLLGLDGCWGRALWSAAYKKGGVGRTVKNKVIKL